MWRNGARFGAFWLALLSWLCLLPASGKASDTSDELSSLLSRTSDLVTASTRLVELSEAHSEKLRRSEETLSQLRNLLNEHEQTIARLERQSSQSSERVRDLLNALETLRASHERLKKQHAKLTQSQSDYTDAVEAERRRARISRWVERAVWTVAFVLALFAR